MTCIRCGQPTVFKSGICRWCQTPAEQSKKPSERRVAFTVDRNGRPIAYRVGHDLRWFRTGYDAAKVAVATGTAQEVRFVSAATR